MKKYILLSTLIISTIAFSQDVLMQNGTVNQCSGTFYDSGGSGGNYSSNENFTLTICPDVAGNLIQVDFSAFSTQTPTDVMTIYNGPDDTAPAFGTFTGGGAASNPGLVTATEANTSGCLTFNFTSDGAGITSGWQAAISCFEPCQTIVSQLDSASPAPNGDGYIRVCPNEDITLNGSGNFSVDGTGATYEWDLGDGNTIAGQTVTFSYATPGVYLVNLNITDANTDPAPGTGCTNNNLINQVIQVGTEPDFTGSAAADSVLCFGDTTTITGVVTPTEFINDCTPPVSGTTVLPDQSGATYETSVTVDCYDSSQTLTDVNQIVAVCINMEHSYSGDLDIFLISPTGQQTQLYNQGGGGIYFGGANNLDNQVPGVGADYCFNASAAVTVNNGGTVIAGSNPPSNSWAPGTYLPTGSFNTLLGSPLNGDWTLQLVDNLSIDDGTVFGWSIEFDPNLQPPELSFTPVTVTEAWDADPTITNTTGNTITVAPPAAGQYCYTYRTTDDFGCEYTEQVCIDVLPEIITDPPNDLFLCNPGAPPYIFDLTQNTPVITAPFTPPTDLNVSYYETLMDADNETNAIPNPDMYSSSAIIGMPQTIYVRVEYLNSDCYETETFTLNITSQPTINAVPDIELCDDVSNDGTEQFDLEAQSIAILGTQSPADYTVTYYTNLADATADTNALVSPYNNISNPEPIYVRVQLNSDANCFNVTANPLGEFNLIVNTRDSADFNTTPTCDGGTATITGDLGGTFSFNPLPTDGATIDGATGTVTNGTSGATYTIEYTTTGICPNSATQTLTVLTEDDPAFAMTPTCDGGTATITGDAGGMFSFNPAPTDGATIDPATGTVTNGTSSATYTVEYATSGTCPATATQNLTVLPLEDASFTMTATCDGATATITGDSGGVFTFNPLPTDGAVIDASTGTITGGVFGTTYTVDYTTSGPCPEMTTQNVTVLDSDDGSFTVTPDCNGGTVVINGTPGGIFALVPAPTDAAVIDAATGTVTNATSGASYTIEYTTPGTCSVINTETLNVLPEDDSSFTTMPTCDGGTATITGLVGGQFSFNPIPTDGAAIDAATGTITGGVSGTTYTIEYLTNGNCPTSTTQNVTVYPQPIAIDPTPLETCDDGTPDGFTAIELTLKDAEITGGNPNYAVSYYLTQADADAPVNALASPYTNTTNPQTVYVRVEDTTTGCYDTTTLELVVEQAPVAFTPNDLVFCDPDSDGFGVFTLTDADAEITGGVAGLTVSYHETMANAMNNVNALTSPYNNIVINTQTIYVRVESTTIATDCASFVELQLVVNPTPQITDPTPLEVCDDDTDGLATFDLTTKDPEILNALDGNTTNDLDPAQYSVSYYLTMADADAGTNAIATPNAYNNTSNPQTLHVRVEDTANSCYKLTTLELIVNPLPVLVQPDPLELCDDNNPGDETELFILEAANAQILNGQTGLVLSYYETQADADAGTNPIVSPYANTSNAQTIYVNAQNTVTGCVSTVTLDLRVNPLPSPLAMPVALEDCDTDNDGFGSFDLDSQIPSLLNGEPGITITFHETQANAESGTAALESPYVNVEANTQTIYVRAENTGTAGIPATGCYRVVELPLIVQPSPVIPLTLEDYVVCDDDQDGINQFDFEAEITPQIFTAEQTAADFTLSYHTTQADADSGNNAIVNTTNYTNQSNPQTLYIRLESNGNGCVTTRPFTIEVALPPVLDPAYDNELSQCDDLDADYMENNDGINSFDLTVEDAEIVNGNNSWIVTYYETQADAQADTNAIANPTAYTNTMTGPQTLYIRVTDNDTGCYSFTTVTLRVLPNPSPSPDPMDLILCDDMNTGDMIESFDLTQNEAFIINGEAGVTVSYYTDQDDALTASNAIADPTLHSNEDPDNPGTGLTPQTIYVRVTNGDDPTGLNGTGCYSLVSFDVIVNPLPEVTPVADYIICELNTDGVAGFDLESMTPAVLGGQDPAVFTVTYHESLAEAEAAMNALGSPYNNTSNPQTIYVNITNTVTGCDVTTLTFNIEVQEAAQANPDGEAIVYEACDDNMEFDNNPANDTVMFDLSTQNPFVLDGQDATNYTVSYYATQADADAATNPLPFNYTNTVNPQVIIVRVDNDTQVDDGTGTGDTVDSSICYDTAEITLQVNPLPAFDLEDAYVLCINTNGTEVIGAPTLDTGLNAAIYSFEWLYEGATIAGETGPSIIPAAGGNYTVIVTDITTSPNTMCSSSDTTLVEVSEPPVVSAEITTEAFADQHDIQVTTSTLATNTVAQYEFSLDGGPWEFNTPNDNNYTFTDVGAGEHTITVRDINGCGEQTITVIVMDYPLYFTPNSDGYNDTWNIYAIGTQPDAVIYIFDRYGKLLKQLSPTGEGWDGTYNGNPMPTSDYWFTVEYREPNTDEKKNFRAHFTLKR